MSSLSNLLLAGALACGAVDFATADDARPLREAESANKQFYVRIRPGRPGLDAARGCRATLFQQSAERHRARRRWERFLVNDVAPEIVHISNDGRFVITLNEYQRGGARHALVIYGERAELLRHFLLPDLLVAADWDHVKVDKRSIEWLTGATFRFVDKPLMFVVKLKHGREIRVDLNTLRVLRADSAGAATVDTIPTEFLALLFGEDAARGGQDAAQLTESSPDERARAEALAEEIAGRPESAEAAGAEAAAQDDTALEIGEQPAVADTAAPDARPSPSGESEPGEPPRDREEPEISPELPPESTGQPAVPRPDPAEPFDYLAWLNASVLTDGPSAAPDYQTAMDTLVPWESDSGLLRAALRGDPQALAAPEVQDWLSANREAMAYFRSGTELEFNGWELRSDDGRLISALLPHLGPMRQLARATVIEGRTLQAQGQAAAAAADYLDTLAAGAHAGNGPTLIENLVGIAIQTTAADALMDLPTPETGADLDYVDLANRLERTLQPARPLTDPLRAERAMFMDTLQHIYNYDPDTGRYTVNEDEANTYLALVSMGGEDPTLRTEQFLRLQTTGFDRTVAAGNAFYDAAAQALSEPYPEAARRLREIEAQFSDGRGANPLLQTLAPSFSRYHFVRTRGETVRRAARLVTHLRAYRQEHGAYPDSLDAFSGHDFTVDPFTGRAFHYRLAGDDFVLYSAGANGTDDGGAHDPKAEQNDFCFWPRP